jgi:hypothetical protein
MMKKITAAGLALLGMAASAQALDPFTVTIGGTPHTFNAFESAEAAAAWYGYGSPDAASANPTPDVRRSNGHVITLVNAIDGLHLVVIEDHPSDADGGRSTLDITCSGDACADSTVVLADDSSEPFVPSGSGSGSISWVWSSCCTDGMVYGPFKGSTCFSLDLQLRDYTGVDKTYVASSNGDGTATVTEAGAVGDLVRFEGCSDPLPGSCPDGAACKTALCDGGSSCASASVGDGSASEVHLNWASNGDACDL